MRLKQDLMDHMGLGHRGFLSSLVKRIRRSMRPGLSTRREQCRPIFRQDIIRSENLKCCANKWMLKTTICIINPGLEIHWQIICIAHIPAAFIPSNPVAGELTNNYRSQRVQENMFNSARSSWEDRVVSFKLRLRVRCQEVCRNIEVIDLNMTKSFP